MAGTEEERPSKTLFIANIPSDTEQSEIVGLASNVAGYTDCRVRSDRRKQPCAFVEFTDRKSAILGKAILEDSLKGTKFEAGRIQYALVNEPGHGRQGETPGMYLNMYSGRGGAPLGNARRSADAEDQPSCTVFITNVPESLSVADLTPLVSKCDGYVSCRTRLDRRKQRCAFVEFKDLKSSILGKAALEEKDKGTLLEGAKFQFASKDTPASLPMARQGYPEAPYMYWGQYDKMAVNPPALYTGSERQKQEPKPGQVALFIEGIPMGTMRREIMHVVRQYPGLVDCRLKPSKSGKNVLCFVEYASLEEAEAARKGIDGYIWDEEDVLVHKLKADFAYNTKKEASE